MSEQKPDPNTQSEAAEDTTSPDEPEAASQGDPAQETNAAEQLDALQAEVGRLKDEQLRALAEVENVRKRAARDKADASKYAVTGLARDLLVVADNLRRALSAVAPETRGKDPSLDGLIVGVEMTEKELMAAFQRHGITPIDAEGHPFNPHVHEAMFEIPDESVPAGTVLQVVDSGFMIHDRPLRPARVGVSRGGPKVPPKPASAEERAAAATDGGASAYEKASDPKGDASGSKVDETL